MQLIDEQENPTFGFPDLLEHRLEPFLKFAAVFGPGDQGPHIQGEDGLVPQAVRDIPPDDPLGQALGDGGFAHAGLADEDGVVFGFAGEDPDDVADLVVPADDRVHLLAAGPFHQVGAVFFQRVVGALGAVAGDPGISPDPHKALQHRVFLNAVLPEQPGQRVVRQLDQAEEKGLDRDIFVLHALGLPLGGGESFVHILRYIDFAGLPARAGDLGQAVHRAQGVGLHLFGGNAHFQQQLRDQPLLLSQQRGEEVLLLELHVLMLHRQILGLPDRLQGLLGEFLCVHTIPSSPAAGGFMPAAVFFHGPGYSIGKKCE